MEDVTLNSSQNNIKTMTVIYGIGNGFAFFDRVLIAMLFPFVLPAFGLDYSQGGLLLSCMAVGYIVFSILGGNLSDRVGRKKILLPSLIVFSVGSMITGFANNFAQLIGIRTAIGAFEGSYNSAAAAQVSEEAPPEKKGSFMGLYLSFAMLLLGFFCPIYATNVGAALGWRWACYLTIIPGVILALLAWRTVKETKKTWDLSEQNAGEKVKVSYLDIFKEKNIIVCIIMAMFGMTWQWSWTGYGTSFFMTERGFDAAAAGGIMSAMGLGGWLGMMAVPALSDKFGRKKTMAISAVIAFLFTLLLIYQSANLPPAAIFIIFFVAAFFGNGMFPIFLLTASTESVRPELGASTVGLVSSIGEIVGIAIAPPILGAIGDSYNLTMSMTVAAFALVIAFFVNLLLRETAPNIIKQKSSI
ncbi:MFS transporter [Sinanaerobacter chloroacetimidivorans]|jgi:predicted MFS family arabinose efflux permease|uniref:MFS transporter n=1 Tax=Sinanaerobacter chloroacetimidivorans TaxID=2818044 RepID=A0A8J8B2Y8_9FIRM|nr:MFS transporter [Sinanaerobacter chloroacetimidivorans]MBR0599814.1 MFS transporter [Sinanaerobacter chloroacetimidivorans]